MPRTKAPRGEKTHEETNARHADSDRKRGRPARTEVEPRQMLALHLLMAGKSRKEVADQLVVTQKTIGRWLREPAVMVEFAHQTAAVSAELWTQFTAETVEVWTIFRGLLHSEDERIQLRAATWYLDRVLSLVSIERVLEDGPRTMPALPPSLARYVGELPDEDRGDPA